MSALSVCEFAMVFVIKFFVDRDIKHARLAEDEGESGAGRNEVSDGESVPVAGKGSDSN